MPFYCGKTRAGLRLLRWRESTICGIYTFGLYTYEVYGIAEFTINKDGAFKDYSIEAEHKQIEVSG
ncbi:hypothetical protein HMSSN036_89220 [Paenibacillus macerans]|nr:hypothetical protein HMSSN036_89220 [Paenibacillus macerans]